MNRSKLASLIQRANDIVCRDPELQKEGYDNQVSAFAVTVALCGLCPALAIFHEEADKFNRIKILDAIAQMIDPEGWKDGRTMSKALFSDDSRARKYKPEIIDCAIALKQVIRTY
jgi:hypothetical protein